MRHSCRGPGSRDPEIWHFSAQQSSYQAKSSRFLPGSKWRRCCMCLSAHNRAFSSRYLLKCHKLPAFYRSCCPWLRTLRSSGSRDQGNSSLSLHPRLKRFWVSSSVIFWWQVLLLFQQTDPWTFRPSLLRAGMCQWWCSIKLWRSSTEQVQFGQLQCSSSSPQALAGIQSLEGLIGNEARSKDNRQRPTSHHHPESSDSWTKPPLFQLRSFYRILHRSTHGAFYPREALDRHSSSFVQFQGGSILCRRIQ